MDFKLSLIFNKT